MNRSPTNRYAWLVIVTGTLQNGRSGQRAARVFTDFAAVTEERHYLSFTYPIKKVFEGVFQEEDLNPVHYHRLSGDDHLAPSDDQAQS